MREGNLCGGVGHEANPSSCSAKAFLSCLWTCLLGAGDGTSSVRGCVGKHKRSDWIITGSNCFHNNIYQAYSVCRPSNKHGINPGVQGGTGIIHRIFNMHPRNALNTYLHRSAY